MDEDNKKTADYWLKWIKDVQKNEAYKTHKEDALSAWDEYDYKTDANSLNKRETKSRYPIYQSSCKLIEPKLYSKTPNIVTKRAFEVNDALAQTQRIILERLGNYLMENGCMDEAMNGCVQDFIHADKTTLQVMYDFEKQTQTIKRYLQVMDDTGEFYEGSLRYDGEVFQDENGYFYEKKEEVFVNQQIYLAHVPFDEILHTPGAKTDKEIKERAFFFSLDYNTAVKKFCTSEEGVVDEAKCKTLPWKHSRATKEEDIKDRENMPGKYLCGWEIWCEITKKVYWVSEGYKDYLLEPSEDLYGLSNFFPSAPFIIGNKPRKSLYPTPRYVHLEPTIKELHKTYQTVFSNIKGIRRRAIVDASVPEVKRAFEELGNNEFILINNLNKLIEKGGLENIIQYIPVRELVDAVRELVSIQEQFKANFNEWFGVPEILRGAATDPNRTLGEQEIMAQATDDRFKNDKKKIAQLARNGLQMMIDLALNVFDDEKMMRCCGFQYLDEAQKINFAPALEQLRNDKERELRIDIETDSTSFSDEDLRHRQHVNLTNALMSGLQSVAGLIQTGAPQTYVFTGLKALLHSLEAMPGSANFTDNITQVIQELVQSTEQAKNAPPAPNPDMIKAQLEEAKLGLKNNELAIKARESEAKIQKDAIDTQIKQQEVTIKGLIVKLEESKTFIKQQNDYFTQQIQRAYLDIDNFKAQILGANTMADNQRLENDSKARMIEAIKPVEPSEPKDSGNTVIINNSVPEPEPIIQPVPVPVVEEVPVIVEPEIDSDIF